jgi:dihydropteroate synthase
MDRPWVMGIINLTPDSFYAGSRISGEAELLRQAAHMIAEGADILDLGAQSTRPGAQILGAEEEIQRLDGAIDNIHRHFPDCCLSIDTFYARVAREAVQAGASMVNDTSAGSIDPGMMAAVAVLQVPYVCMHSLGLPLRMNEKPQYEQVTQTVLDFFIQKKEACRQAGIHDLILDPGFGFGKTTRHNFEILKQLPVFRILDCPILVGLSRKSSIYKMLGVTVDQALNGTTVLNTVALLNGANLLRVHDVRQAREAITLVQALND